MVDLDNKSTQHIRAQPFQYLVRDNFLGTQEFSDTKAHHTQLYIFNQSKLGKLSTDQKGF